MKNNVIQGPWKDGVCTAETATTLGEKIRAFLAKISQKKSKLYFEPFMEMADIWPDQCDYAATSVKALQDSLKEFLDFIKSRENFPADIAPKRYVLLVSLSHAHEESNKLNLLLLDFRGTCRTPQKANIKKRSEIQKMFESLLGSIDDFLKEKTLLESLEEKEYKGGKQPKEKQEKSVKKLRKRKKK